MLTSPSDGVNTWSHFCPITSTCFLLRVLLRRLVGSLCGGCGCASGVVWKGVWRSLQDRALSLSVIFVLCLYSCCDCRVFLCMSELDRTGVSLNAVCLSSSSSSSLDQSLKDNAIVGNTGRFGNEIDLTGSVGLDGMQVDNIVPPRLATTDFCFRASGLQTLCQLQFCLRQ